MSFFRSAILCFFLCCPCFVQCICYCFGFSALFFVRFFQNFASSRMRCDSPFAPQQETLTTFSTYELFNTLQCQKYVTPMDTTEGPECTELEDMGPAVINGTKTERYTAQCDVEGTSAYTMDQFWIDNGAALLHRVRLLCSRVCIRVLCL
eukprot:TRINITY_DN12730_c1_g1_i6.p2 TRINITY_DN12730_c1_g1~~TRINITY_DN12730_c1_g1_i6.p2  ORF type:complete len:150 (+),score=24.35 TRINITY_DN12730_c1_g1_i6:648-1097(+)